MNNFIGILIIVLGFFSPFLSKGRILSALFFLGRIFSSRRVLGPPVTGYVRTVSKPIAMYSRFISIAFLALPFLLMLFIPSFRKKGSLVYWGSLVIFAIISFSAIYIFFQLGQPVLNGPIAQFTGFIFGPVLVVFAISRPNFLWKHSVIGIICVPISYFIGWIGCINIGMGLGCP